MKAPAVGSTVTAECFERCGACDYCASGRFNLCDDFAYMGGRDTGALATAVTLPGYAVHCLPDELADDLCVLVEPQAVALRAVRRCNAPKGSAVGIIGAGAIGLLCTVAARAAGLQPIVLAKHPHQAAAARALGAHRVVQLGKEKPTDAMIDDSGNPLPAVIDSVSQGTSLNTALSVAGAAGRVVIVGEVTRPALAMLSSLVHGEKTITGSFCYGKHGGVHDFARAIDLLRGNASIADVIISHRFPLSESQEALRVAADKSTEAIKVIVEMPEL
jgi:threonine dehydrogenase-like Zn-dependent dehydrogenase